MYQIVYCSKSFYSSYMIDQEIEDSRDVFTPSEGTVNKLAIIAIHPSKTSVLLLERIIYFYLFCLLKIRLGTENFGGM